MDRWAEKIETLLSEWPGQVSLTVEALAPGGGATGFCLQRHPEAVYPAASLIKLPILLTVLEAAECGGLSLATEVVVGGEGTGGAGVVEHLRPGTRLTLADLLFCMIAVSDNAATNHVLDLVGLEAVNAWSEGMGLAGTVLRRRMMDGEARRAGRENLTTPADIHRLLRELQTPVRLSPAVTARARALLARQQLKLGWATFLPDERLAHKTGDLEGLFHDAGVLDPDGPVPVVYTFFSAGGANLGEASLLAGRVGETVAAWAGSLASEGEQG
jgi:beta-lactamase class A